MKQHQRGNETTGIRKGSGVFFLILSICICAIIIVTGCVQVPGGNISGNHSIESSVGQNVPTLPQSVNTTPEQAAEEIRRMTGISYLNLTYDGIIHGSNADSYKFEADIGEFYVNAMTGRVQNAVFFEPPVPSTKEIDLDQAYLVALIYAQQKYPSLWETSDTKGVVTAARERVDHGDYFDYNFYWHDEYYSSDNTNRYTIAGPNLVLITLSPTGAVKSYDERVVPVDPSLDLKPDISESQAWTIAQNYFASHGAANVTKRADRSQELAITSDESHIQRLTWHFEALNNSTPPRGGEIWIDAHTGTVVDYLPVL
jgi:Peptidase propeptide and YPEB domain.